MRRNLQAYSTCQVFLNYPFDEEFEALAEAMSFAIVAGGLVPICAYDLASPDRPRLEMLVEAIQSCRYSAHDFSRSRGAGVENFARMNMPIEMGMALFHALDSRRRDHRCVFFVSSPHDYKAFASDLAGLDPKVHNGDDSRVLVETYVWLRDVVPDALFNRQATTDVQDKYAEFKSRRNEVKGSGNNGRLSHDETRELMYRVCSECSWWDWRSSRMGKDQFPEVPLTFIAKHPTAAKLGHD